MRVVANPAVEAIHPFGDAHEMRGGLRLSQPTYVMPGLVPGIHALRRRLTSEGFYGVAAWMAGTSPAMTYHTKPVAPLTRRKPLIAFIIPPRRQAPSLTSLDET